MVDRRATLGMSVDELVMVRIGHLIGVLCFLFVLPILPFIAVFTAMSKAFDTGEEPSRPSYQPGEFSSD